MEIKIGEQLVLPTFLILVIFEKLYFVKMRPIFDGLLLCTFFYKIPINISSEDVDFYTLRSLL